MGAMVNDPMPHQAKHSGPVPYPSGRLDIVLNRTGASAAVRCWINDEKLFSHERNGGWSVVPPGRHKVVCEAEGRGGFGKVTQFHDVRPGENVHIFYAPPLFLFSKGAMGRTPQQRTWAMDWPELGKTILATIIFLGVCFALYLLFGR